ncbi:MAG: YihY/virulence factor BrkB family protein [Candidatus Dormibacteria bacterium]
MQERLSGLNVDSLKGSVPGKVVVKFGQDQGLNWATLIAWSALLAMFPILLLGASIVGLVLGMAGISEAQIVGKVSGAIRDQGTQEVVKSALTSFKQRSGIFAVVGFLGLLFGGSALFGSMEQGFAIIYHAAPRSFVKQKLVAIFLIVPFSVLAGLAIVSSSVLPALKNVPNVPDFLSGGPLSYLLQILLGAITGFLLFALIYFIVPNRRQEWTKVWPGSLLAGTLFSLLVLLFPFYLEVNKGIQNYGKTPALLLTLMAFFFFLGIITMVGAELNSVLYPVPVEQPNTVPGVTPDPKIATQKLAGSSEAEKHGGTVSDHGVAVLTPEMAEEANAGIAGLAAARERVGKARTLVGVGALGWALGMALGRRTAGGRRPL